MRAFITGASGFIGSHLLEELLKKDYDIRVLIHRRDIQKRKEVEYIRGDILDFNLLRNAFEHSDVVFHLAAALGSSVLQKDEFIRINTIGTENVLKAAEAAGVKRVIHISSAGIFGAVQSNEAVSEDYPPVPISLYDQSKLEGENIVRRFFQKGNDIVLDFLFDLLDAGDIKGGIFFYFFQCLHWYLSPLSPGFTSPHFNF